jgi:acetamidase/formamidase
VDEMIDFLVERKGLTPGDAYLLCSVAVDQRITQVVDGTKGVHALLARSILDGR